MNAYFNQPYGYGYGPMPPFFGPAAGFGWPGFGGPMYQPVPMGGLTWGGTYAPYTVWSGYGGLGGLRRHGGSYSAQFMDTGLPTDEEISEMIYDAMDVDPLIPYDADINVTVDAGEVTLTGTVANKSIKHAAGDDSWWIPGVVDVHNQLKVSGRRRTRGGTEAGQ